MKTDMRLVRRLQVSASALALVAGWAGSAGLAHAQGAAAKSTTSANGQAVDEVVVTGSRIVRSTFNTPNPVTVIDQQQIQKLNLTNAGDVIAQLPQNSNFFSGNNVGLGNFNVGAQLANLRGLNPFFGTRTLTLMNTQRIVPTTTGGAVDVTLIPSQLIGRVDTETGGASAVYGSDAVAGVVNIILDTKLTGLKGQVDFGQTQYGDGQDGHVSLGYGHGFAGDRGHFIIGGEFENSASIGLCSQVRSSWCGTNEAVITNGDYNTPNAPGYGQPHYIVGPNARSANVTLTGVLSPCTVAGPFCTSTTTQMQFNGSGSALVPYTRGLYGASSMQGGDTNAVGPYDGTTMRPQVRRYTALGHADYDITPTIKGSLEGWFARSNAINPIANGAIGASPVQVNDYPALQFSARRYPIAADNAYLTAAESAYVNSQGSGIAEFGRNLLNTVTAQNQTNNDTWRVVGSLKGDLGNSWGWDAYAEYGDTETKQFLFHNVVGPFLTFALDAARNGSGQIVCGVNIPGRINPATGVAYTAANIALAAQNGGCQPLNLFGVGNASAAALNYVFPTLSENVSYNQAVVSGNIHGNLFQGWGAGPLSLAAGAEYRHEYGNVTHNLENQPFYASYSLSYGLDYKGATDVFEGYGELNVPLLKDAPFAKYAEINGAVRETYNKATNQTVEPAGFTVPLNAGQSASHTFPTWKVSGIWDVTDWLRFRGTRSRDVRAPQFRELFQSYARAASGPFASVTNPYLGNIPQQTNIFTGGTLALKPEVADTLTAGVVLSPKSSWLDRIRFSADWYEIVINDPIAGPPFGIGAQNIVNSCYANAASFFCSLVQRDSGNNITSVNNSAANLGKYTTRGVDFEAAYTLPLDQVSKGWAGDLNFRVLASYMYDLIIDAGRGGPLVNYAGQSGPTGAFGGYNTSPYWQGNGYFTYSNGPFSGTIQLRYVGAGRFTTLSAFGGQAVTPGSPGYSSTNPNSINENSVPSEWYVNLAGSYNINQHFTLFANVNNLFNQAPPIAPGGNGYPTNPVYFDTLGLTWKAGARFRF
ncbi:MAG: TonB-dependent receptor domain-containing protein [Caulobacteraceae bacterium]